MESTASPQATIMIVEDYDDTRLMLKTHLEIIVFRVFEAADGNEALELAEKECENLDLILMDLSLPGLDGLSATRLLRQITKLCDVPIVACSAHAGAEYKELAKEAGCCDLVAKPIDFEHLEKVIERCLPEK